MFIPSPPSQLLNTLCFVFHIEPFFRNTLDDAFLVTWMRELVYLAAIQCATLCAVLSSIPHVSVLSVTSSLFIFYLCNYIRRLFLTLAFPLFLSWTIRWRACELWPWLDLESARSIAVPARVRLVSVCRSRATFGLVFGQFLFCVYFGTTISERSRKPRWNGHWTLSSRCWLNEIGIIGDFSQLYRREAFVHKRTH